MRRTTLAIATCLALAAGFATAAQAATLKLSCVGKGPRNRDSANTVLCAGGTKGRTISGTIRNDAGAPVAGRVTITTSNWVPAGGGSFSVKAIGTRDITAKPNGTFSFTANPATRQSFKLDLAADPALGIAGGASAEAEISRLITVKITKLAGGRVRLTVGGVSVRPVKAYVLSPDGEYLAGVPRGKNIDSKGRATYNLRGKGRHFSYYIDAGKYDDIFWDHRSTKFSI